MLYCLCCCVVCVYVCHACCSIFPPPLKDDLNEVSLRHLCGHDDLVVGGVQDELGPHAVVLWAAVVEQGVGQVRHPLSAQRLAAHEEHSILAREGENNGEVGPSGQIYNLVDD